MAVLFALFFMESVYTYRMEGARIEEFIKRIDNARTVNSTMFPTDLPCARTSNGLDY